MDILLKEHYFHSLKVYYGYLPENSDSSEILLLDRKEDLNKIKARKFKRERGKDYYCYDLKIADNKINISTNYFVGIDWFWQNGKHTIQVEPKINSTVYKHFEQLISLENENLIDQVNANAEKNIFNNFYEKEVDCVAMLMEIISYPDVAKKTDQLLLIDWDSPQIKITQKQDLLTPFIIIRFLKILQDIVRKGLKKSYYKVQDNLKNRFKGKILTAENIKRNIFKNNFTDTLCEYQVFGENSIENRFLKKVFLFCVQYIENDFSYFKNKKNIEWVINYIRPVFENINDEINLNEIKNLKHNPFFKEYKEAIDMGHSILKKFSYNITKTTEQKIFTPPFWIDMPKMFELYIYAKLLKDNSNISATELNHQFSTYGNSLDFLICSGKTKIVVDAKYKLQYNYKIIHDDIRQVAGYARLKKVKSTPPIINDEEIACLIIYPNPDLQQDVSLNLENLLNENNEIKAYHKVYKIGIPLPLIKP
ncbi:5-methylcytosine restriction system specificity protein McrC [Chryseobacterium sp. MMS23-Vi53]|uniref:5-methylcytosine restriction system specificity protein McrC n=1 Tax=Chryseobacterium sp. MMS23-Vi53 TaxID=3386644 RepID=UPI0039EC6D12